MFKKLGDELIGMKKRQNALLSMTAERRIQAVAFTLLTVLFVAIYLIRPDFYETVWMLSTSGDIEDTLNFLRSFGHWALVVSFFIDVLINALGFLPSIFISTANGLLFGVKIGVLVSWLAESVGVIISFLLMRFIFRDYALLLIKKSSRLQDIDNFSGKNGLQLMLMARTLPYFPSGILTALGAISQISLRDYVIATFIGKFPSTALEVVIGHDLVNYQQHMDRLAITVTIVVIVYTGIILYKRKNGGWTKKEEE